jgi:hypothetical protein
LHVTRPLGPAQRASVLGLSTQPFMPHAWHTPSQEVLQQTPPVQMPLSQPAASLHGVPWVRSASSRPCRRGTPAASTKL